MSLDSLKDGLFNTIAANPVATAAGVAGAGVALGVGAAAIVGAVNKRKSKRRKTRNSRKRNSKRKRSKRSWSQDRKRHSKQPWEVAYRRRKRKGNRRKGGIHYTRNGQPYKILSNGRARFIKKKRRSHR